MRNQLHLSILTDFRRNVCPLLITNNHFLFVISNSESKVRLDFFRFFRCFSNFDTKSFNLAIICWSLTNGKLNFFHNSVNSSFNILFLTILSLCCSKRDKYLPITTYFWGILHFSEGGSGFMGNELSHLTRWIFRTEHF